MLQNYLNIYFNFHIHPSAENLITQGYEPHDGTTCHMNLWQKVSWHIIWSGKTSSMVVKMRFVLSKWLDFHSAVSFLPWLYMVAERAAIHGAVKSLVVQRQSSIVLRLEKHLWLVCENRKESIESNSIWKVNAISDYKKRLYKKRLVNFQEIRNDD